MAQTGLNIFREQLFGRGYNDKLPPEFIPKGYLADALNCIISQNRIEKRTGYALIGNDTGDVPILGACFIEQADGTRRFYKFHNNAAATGIRILEYTGSGNFTEINSGTLLTNTSNEVNCVVAENVVYAFDGSSTPVVITPGSPSTVAAVTDANFPPGSFGAWFHNFHFVSGRSSLPNRLYWSELNDSDDFTNTTTGSLDVNPNDGDVITALQVLKDELLIFKRNRVWSLTGFGTATFTLSNLNERVEGYGTPSARGTTNIGNDVLYLSNVGGTPEIRAVQRTKFADIVIEGGLISDDISGSFATLNNARLDQTAMGFDGRRVLVSVPGSGSTTNNRVYVYDTVYKGWVRWTGVNATIFVQTNFAATPTIYFGESGNNSLIYTLDGTTTNDNGTAISFQVDTRRYGGDRPEIKKKWKYCYLTTEIGGDYNLTIQQSTDGFTYDSFTTVNLEGSTGTIPFTLDSDRLGSTDVTRTRLNFDKRTSYYLQLRYIQNGLNQDAVIRDWELLYKHRGLRET